MAFNKSYGKAELTYEVRENLGSFYKDSKGNSYEVRVVSWNGREPKYDIRAWGTDEDGNETMKKGITLSGEQIEGLAKLLQELMEN